MNQTFDAICLAVKPRFLLKNAGMQEQYQKQDCPGLDPRMPFLLLDKSPKK
jgi:hypothetical protein